MGGDETRTQPNPRTPNDPPTPVAGSRKAPVGPYRSSDRRVGAAGESEMAWIKMRCGLSTDPRVQEIESILNGRKNRRARRTSITHIIGALHYLWATAFDMDCRGELPSLTPEVLDQTVGIPGFYEALSKVRWISCKKGLLKIPRYRKYHPTTPPQVAHDSPTGGPQVAHTSPTENHPKPPSEPPIADSAEKKASTDRQTDRIDRSIKADNSGRPLESAGQNEPKKEVFNQGTDRPTRRRPGHDHVQMLTGQVVGVPITSRAGLYAAFGAGCLAIRRMEHKPDWPSNAQDRKDLHAAVDAAKRAGVAALASLVESLAFACGWADTGAGVHRILAQDGFLPGSGLAGATAAAQTPDGTPETSRSEM